MKMPHEVVQSALITAVAAIVIAFVVMMGMADMKKMEITADNPLPVKVEKVEKKAVKVTPTEVKKVDAAASKD